jgi:hypothetical protein
MFGEIALLTLTWSLNNVFMNRNIRQSWVFWWLTPIILAAQEAEIRRIKVPSQPREIVCETLS